VIINSDKITLGSGTRIDVSNVDVAKSRDVKGRSGSITIRAKTLDLSDGGQLISTTGISGETGKVSITADQVTLSGVDTNFNNKRAFLSFINNINSRNDARKAIKNYLEDPTSDKKKDVIDIIWPVRNNEISSIDREIFREIITNYFVELDKNSEARAALKEFARLTNESEKLIRVLNFKVFVNSSEKSGIVSQVPIEERGNGGSINIDVTQFLLLRNQAQVLATAATGKGGDIIINTPVGVVVAVPLENSSISANAINGTGGVVKINALNVLGFSTTKSDRLSKITADGGTQGVVTINAVGNDPNKGLQPNPIEPGAPDLTQDCRAINNTQISKLASSGKGGITPNPNELIPTNNIWTDKAGTTSTKQPTPIITAAKGWITGQGRTVILTSQPSSYQPTDINSTNRNCYAK
jgi:hypothetical protein